MEPEYIGAILSALRDSFSINPDAEITMETNPGTVAREKIEQFLAKGINRFSIGIQSFHPEDLAFLTRIHDSETAQQTVRMAKDAGCTNVSIDLIFNLPGQTKEKWLANLETAFSLPVDHISAYSLILERGTILNKLVLDGKVAIAGEEHDAELYMDTIRFMEQKGFRQYEVSNFCKPGFECRHNNHYWRYDDYLSFGTSSHSFMNGKRWWNVSSLTLYLESMRQKHHAVAGSETPDAEQRLEEFIMLTLRSSGIPLAELNKNFGAGWLSRNRVYLNNMHKEGYLIISDTGIQLTAKGYAVCDEILLNLK